MQSHRNIRRLFCVASMQVSWLAGHRRFSAFPELITPVASSKIRSLLTVAVPHRIFTGFPFHLPAGQSKIPALRHMKAYPIDFESIVTYRYPACRQISGKYMRIFQKKYGWLRRRVRRLAQSRLSDSCADTKPAIPIALNSLTV